MKINEHKNSETQFCVFFVLGLSTVAVCAPSEKFLNMAGPLSIGLGAVVVASLGKECNQTIEFFLHCYL